MMTSYFNSPASCSARFSFRRAKPIPDNHRAHLPHLIRLRSASVALQVDQFLNACFAKYMVTAFYPFLESQALQ